MIILVGGACLLLSFQRNTLELKTENFTIDYDDNMPGKVVEKLARRK